MQKKIGEPSKNRPIEIKTKFASPCRVCGKTVRTGVYAMYDGKRVRHKTCKFKKKTTLKSSSEGLGW